MGKPLKQNSYSSIKQKLRKEESDLIYSFSETGRERKRNLRMMTLVQKERMDNRIIMNEKREKYLVDKCDICNKSFGEGEPECHHIIPFEIYGPEINFNYAFLCEKCHKIFTHNTLSHMKKDAIDKLKLKGLIKREYFENMIKDGLLQNYHISYLHTAGYIHVVDRLELLKMLTSTKVDAALDNFFKKTTPSTERWTRAMKAVYFYRINYSLIMEKVRNDYAVNRCDGCDREFLSGEPECHHIIPKRIFGPESPYNYAYLCSECHKKFTHNYDSRKEIIVKLKQKNLVSFETIKTMLLNKELNEKHLQFLKDEGFIDNDTLKKLLGLMVEMNSYLL